MGNPYYPSVDPGFYMQPTADPRSPAYGAQDPGFMLQATPDPRSPAYGARDRGFMQTPTIGGQVSPENQALAQALHAMGQHPMGNATGLAGNLGAAALMTMANQMPDQVHLRKPQQMQVGQLPVTNPYGLQDTSQALPDVSY